MRFAFPDNYNQLYERNSLAQTDAIGDVRRARIACTWSESFRENYNFCLFAFGGSAHCNLKLIAS
jgi:hypothetical protein